MRKLTAAVNFVVSSDKHAAYVEACKSLGISMSEICRRALDNAVALAEKLKTPAPSSPTLPAPAEAKTQSPVTSSSDEPRQVSACSDCGLPVCVHDGSGFCPAGTEEFGGRR